MKVVLDEAGRVEVPKCVREQLGIKAGDELTWEQESGGWVLKPREEPITAPPRPADPVLQDWHAYHCMLTSGQLDSFSGKYVVIYEGKLVASGTDLDALEKQALKLLNVPRERLVAPYVDGGEYIVAE
jgi:AbrB family looped-hinge helix DNA binding protein